MVFQTEKALNEVGDKIDAGEKSAVEADLNALKELLEKTDAENMSDSDIDEIKAAKEKLMNGAQQLFTKMYESMQAEQGAAGPDMGAAQDAGAANDDDVVDGSYREV